VQILNRKANGLLSIYDFDLPYGSGSQQVHISQQHVVDLVQPTPPEAAADPAAVIEAALCAPLDDYFLEQFRGAHTAAVAINDKTRPVLHHFLLPPLLKRLEGLDIPSGEISLIVATGTHTPASKQEILNTYPADIANRYNIISHDCDNANELVDLGVTQRGTPVLVNRRFYESDLRIVTGNIEPHHFMGFSGGVKSASIGLAGRSTINANHAMLIDPLTKAGLYYENPMRMDIEEIGRMIGVHYALNTIQNDHLDIVHAIAGHPESVMGAGILHSRSACQVPIQGGYDLVIASAGGFPKDINLYQAQKALTHAAMLVKDGGWIIAAAECREGSGSQSCETFLSDVDNLQEVFLKFQREGFRVGPHKAFQIAREAVRANLVLVSDLPDELARMFFFTPARSIQNALEMALAQLPEPARIAVMPFATHTIPYLSGEAA
jgi:lactate racemase